MQKVFNLMALTSFVVSVTIAAGGFWLYKSRDAIIENAKEQVVKEISEALPGIVKELIPDIPEMPSTTCLLYTSPSPRDGLLSRMPSSA